MGIVQSCCGPRIKDDEKDRNIDPSFHSQMIEGRIKKQLEKYSELYDVLEQKDKTLKILIDNELYEAQLPLIQDEPVILNAASEYNRSFILQDTSQIIHNQTILSPGARSQFGDDAEASNNFVFNRGMIQIDNFDSEVIGTQEDKQDEEEAKIAGIRLDDIEERPPSMSLIQAQSQKPQIYNKEKDKQQLISPSGNELQISSNNLLAPTLNQRKRQNQILKMQTGAGLGGNELLPQKKRQISMEKTSKFDPNTLHFAYVFASPLVLEVSKGFLVEDKLDEISFKEEFEYIEDALHSTKQEIRYSYQLGTQQNMNDVLGQRPLTLHFSGHGLINQRQTFRDIAHAEFHKEVTGKGDVLVMEGQEGGNSHLYFADDLKRLLVCNKSNFKFVVVASCHSEAIGKVFQMAGAEHVICVKTEKELNDRAAVTFARQFYQAVYKDNMSICDAYQLALVNLDSIKDLKNESKDYLLMVQGDKKNHKCKVGEMAEYVRQGKAKCINDQMKLKIIPPNVTNWVPRSLDTYQCIQKLFSEDSRIVQVFGIPGSGKSAILLKVANYLAERGTYPGGIVYANFQNFKRVRKAFMELIDIIETSKENQFKQSDVNNDMQDKEIMDHLNLYIKSGERILFVFDNLDELIINEGSILAEYLNKLVSQRKNLRVLLSASMFIEQPLESFVIKNIKNLNAKKSRDLFIKKIPLDEAKARIFSIESMIQLEQFTTEDSNLTLIEEILNVNPLKVTENKYCGGQPEKSHKSHKSLEDCGKAYLEKHPLFEILNQPLSICLVAAQLRNQQLTIKNIYENLIQATQMKGGLDCSLIVSYMSAFQMLRSKSNYALEILYVISQTATGLHKMNIQKLFQITSIELEENILLLIDTSMVIYDPDNQVYKVQNIIGKFIELSLNDSPESRTKYNRMLASFYLDILTANKQLVNNGEQDLKFCIDIVDYQEKNITKCLNYLISLRYQGKEEEYDRNKTFKSHDQLVNKNYAQFIAKQLTVRFNSKKATQQAKPKKDNKAKKQGFKKNKDAFQTKEEIIINEILEPIFAKDKYQKFKTFRKKSNLLDHISVSPNGEVTDSKQDMDAFINQVKSYVVQDVQNSGKYLTNVSEKDEDGFNLDKIEEEFYSSNEEYKSSSSNQSFKSDKSMGRKYQKSQNSNEEDSPKSNKQEGQDIEVEEPYEQKLSPLREQMKMPALEVYGTRDSWSQAKKTNSGEKEKDQILVGSITISNMDLFPTKKKSEKSLQVQNLIGGEISQPIKKQNSSVGKKMFGGLIKAGNTEQSPNQPKQEFSAKFKQMMEVIGSNINDKLRKLNDKVTEKDAFQYKETVNKFSQFIGQMMVVKPSEAVTSYINNPKRQWSRRPTSKNANINKQASTVHSQYRKNQSVAGKQINEDTPEKNLNNGPPVEQYGATLGLGLPKPKVNRQTSKVSNKSTNNPMTRQISIAGKVKDIQIQPPVLSLDQIRSNTNIDEHLGMIIDQPDDDFDQEFEIECLDSDGEVTQDDGTGEMQILLYHFMSIQALKNRDIKDFMNLKNQFLIDQMDPMFQASIDLLVVYQHLKQKTSHQYAASDLENLLNLYSKEGSLKGQAIVCFFLAFVFQSINTFAALEKAKYYLEKSLEFFKGECDEEGIFYCQKLKVMLQPKSKNDGYEKSSSGNFEGLETFSPSDVRSPTNAQANGQVMSPRSVSGFGRTQSNYMTNNSYRYKLIKDREALNLLINPVDLNKQTGINY